MKGRERKKKQEEREKQLKISETVIRNPTINSLPQTL